MGSDSNDRWNEGRGGESGLGTARYGRYEVGPETHRRHVTRHIMMSITVLHDRIGGRRTEHAREFGACFLEGGTPGISVGGVSKLSLTRQVH